MATDRIANAKRFKDITAGSDLLAPVPAAVYVGGAGNVVAEGDDGNSVTFVATAGSILPIQPTKITSATATGLIGLYN